MDSIANYSTPTILKVGDDRKPLPLKGRFLSRLQLNPQARAFGAADLWRGARLLVEPSLSQAAFIYGANGPTAVWWAAHRLQHRDAIIRGKMPLVPPHAQRSPVPVTKAVNGNGAAAIGDDELFDLVKHIGVSRVLNVMCAIEAA